MKRLLAASAIAIATMSSVLVAVPANAANTFVISSSRVAMSNSGTGKVWVQCKSKKTCTGKVWATGHVHEAQKFSVAANKAAYVNFKMTAWKSLPLDGTGGRPVTLNAHNAAQKVSVLEPVKQATIRGSVTRHSGPAISELEVQLWQVGTRNRLSSVKRISVTEGGNFSFTVPTGANNSTSAKYKVQIIGKQNNTRRTWWWTGTNGTFTGGSMHSGNSTTFSVARNSSNNFDHVANFNYSSVKGRITNGGAGVANTEVTLYARPTTWPKTAAGMKDLDVISCADIVGRVKTNSSGNYDIGFVPVTSNRVYIVKSEDSWWNNERGTCHAAVNYRNASNGASTPWLELVGTSATTKDLQEDKSSTLVEVSVSGYQGTAASKNVDKYVTIREYATGRSVLSSDIVYQGMPSASGKYWLAPGRYWFETGRRQGCSATYDSRFKDNSGYLKGDRANEAWKAKNYKMTREHCRAYSTGAYKQVNILNDGAGSTQTVGLANAKGGTVKGKLTGPTKKSYVEVLIRVSNTNGSSVYRTAMTDGSGNFNVTGLASGTYSVRVNSDSWRGINRAFSGKKTVKVTAGKTTSIGKLTFKG